MTDDLPILDLAVVAELRESVAGDEAFLVELTGAYFVEGPRQLADMETAARAGDASAIVRPAHTLKSSSAALGAMRLAAICRKIEFDGRGGHVNDLLAQVEEARATWEATVAEMTAAGLVQ